MRVRIGTRGSQLALAQSRLIGEMLAQSQPGLETEIVIIQTQGDRVLDAPLSVIGGKGVFTKEIERALLSGRIDLAVHSLKDLPTQNPPGLAVAAIPQRESPRDILVTTTERRLEDFDAGDVIGTSSLRRAAQLRARYPQVTIKEIRGNVPTRLRRLTEGGYSAIVLAAAGVRRLGLSVPVARVLSDDEMLPAPGQGALGLQIRADDAELAAVLAKLNNAEAWACCVAERTLLDRLGGGCQVPLAALAEFTPDGRLRLRGRVVPLDGSRVVECELFGSPEEPEALGALAAKELRAAGAAEIIEKALAVPPSVAMQETAESQAGPEMRVLVTRDEDADGPLSRSLREHRLVPVCLPVIRTRLTNPVKALGSALEELGTPDWVFVSSNNAVEALNAAPEVLVRLKGARFGVVGKKTAEGLRRLGCEATIIGEGGREELLAGVLPQIASGDRCLVVTGNLTPPRVAEALLERGARVAEAEVYETIRADNNGALLGQLLRGGECQAVVFCSASAVEALVEMLQDAPRLLESPPVLCVSIGSSTTEALERAGFAAVHQVSEPSFERIAAELAQRFATRR